MATQKKGTKKTTPAPAVVSVAAEEPRLNLTAADVRDMALRNLTAKADAGDKLNDSDWQRLDALIAHEEGPDPIDALLDRLDAETKKMGKRKRIPAAVAELGKLAIIAKNTDHLWANRDEAAAELKVSIQTVSNWCGELNIDANRTTIVKAEVYRGLWLREKEKYENHKSEKDEIEQQLRILDRQGKIDERTGRLNDLANLTATTAIIRLVTDMRGDWLNNWPPLLSEIIAQLDSNDAMKEQGAYYRFIKTEMGKTIDRLYAQQQELAAEAKIENEKETKK